MANRTVYSDENNNEMDCYLNDNGKVFISIGQASEDDIHFSGFIVLDKDDVNQLIKTLTEIEKIMPE